MILVIEKLANEKVVQIIKSDKEKAFLLMTLFVRINGCAENNKYFKSYSYSRWKLLQSSDVNIMEKLNMLSGSEKFLPISYKIQDENELTLVMNIQVSFIVY